MTITILLVEDEKLFRSNLTRHLTHQGYKVTDVADAKSALEIVKGISFDIMLSDLRLPDMPGSELIQQVLSTCPSTISILMTAHGTLDTAIAGFRNGAQDYLLKPFAFNELDEKIERIIASKQQVLEDVHLRHIIQPLTERNTNFKGKSVQSQKIQNLIKKIAPSPSTVLITGESGTGKDVVAKSIHQQSLYSDGPLVSLNVSAIPDGLLESYLFGHVRGSFTGASQSREGAFRAANGGTLLLDEIGEMNLEIQPKLLRAVEEQSILPVGSDTPVKVNLRLITATNRNLREMVERGEFREDLYFRLNIVNIHIMPLRERIEDIPVLVEHLLDQFRERLQKPVLSVDTEVMRYLMQQPWKGNVRELANVLERACIFCEDHIIKMEDLPENHQQTVTKESSDLDKAVNNFKYRHILSVLESVGGNREMAAKDLGLSSATLYRQLEKLGLKGHKAKIASHAI
ncbi:MAG: sigma-54 dependent transcriptional regulator [Methylococcaceae bacterium]|nr:sigma-54 dependent transcriptional regulator [Methylococcaceae bacterium]